MVSLGGSNKVVVSPSEIFRMAIYKMATKMILVHNHPSGIVQPSEDDLKLTQSMVQAGVILKIKVIDHLIITENEFLSIQE